MQKHIYLWTNNNTFILFWILIIVQCLQVRATWYMKTKNEANFIVEKVIAFVNNQSAFENPRIKNKSALIQRDFSRKSKNTFELKLTSFWSFDSQKLIQYWLILRLFIFNNFLIHSNRSFHFIFEFCLEIFLRKTFQFSLINGLTESSQKCT